MREVGERWQPRVSDSSRITNVHVRHRIFILHVCSTARVLYITLIGAPTPYVYIYTLQ